MDQSTDTAKIFLPPLMLPLFYLGFASLSFGLALLGAFLYAQDFTGFYYHPRILALTHLVTLGWITGNILGTIFIVGPMALQMRLPARKTDHAVFWIYVSGVAGMVSHFWIGHSVGMAWSAGCVYLTLLYWAVKVLRTIRKTKMPGFVKLHVGLAFTNILVAGAWGLLVAINKVHGFLPTLPAPNVLGHAHMATIGWASLMVFGIAYRLLPMFLPGEPAKGPMPWISALLLEAGAVGLFLTLLAQSPLTLVFGFMIAAGIALFFSSVIRTALRRKPAPPPEPPRPDFAILHALFSFLWLAAAIVAGLALTQLPATPRTLQLALAYGFIGLVGFLGQIVTGMKPKILSIFTWYYAFTRAGTTASIPRPVDMPLRPLQAITFGFWFLGIPLFAAGSLFESAFIIRAGAIALLTALLISVIHEAYILRLIFRE